MKDIKKINEDVRKILIAVAILLSALLWWGWLWALVAGNDLAPIGGIIVLAFFAFMLLFTVVLVISAWKCRSIKSITVIWVLTLVIYGYFPMNTWMEMKDREKYRSDAYHDSVQQLETLLQDSTTTWQQVKPFGQEYGMDKLYVKALSYKRADLAKPITERWIKPEKLKPSVLLPRLFNYIFQEEEEPSSETVSVLNMIYMTPCPGEWSAKGAKEVVELLLDNGDLDINSYVYVAMSAEERFSGPLLFLALEKGDTATTALLLNRGANPRKGDGQGGNVLHYAAKDARNLEFVKRFIDLGIEVDKQEFGRGDTPVSNAIRSARSLDIVRLLVEHGADPTYLPSISEEDTVKVTYSEEMRKYLIEKGVKLENLIPHQ